MCGKSVCVSPYQLCRRLLLVAACNVFIDTQEGERENAKEKPVDTVCIDLTTLLLSLRDFLSCMSNG